MASAAYKVISIDLASVVTGKPIPGTNGADVAFVGIISRPAGSVASLRFGSGNDDVDITDQWTGIRFDPPHDTGVLFTVPSVQAGTIKILLSFWKPCTP